MQRRFILFVLVVIFLVCSPVAASTKKIASGAPVFVGESDLDIASAIQDCKIIAWWPAGSDMSGPAARNLTLKRVNDVILPVNHFNISPNVFQGYPGYWYCEDKQPRFRVLNVMEPEISIRVWDVDKNEDISGKTVPFSTNVTYRIDTNLNLALSYNNRTDLTPADGFITVTWTNPSGKAMSNFYTGSVGGASTQILPFDNTPFVTTPVYYGKKLESWNHLSRDASGSLLYPPGTYTFTLTQNLSRMQESYATAGITNLSGVTFSSASVTFLPKEALTRQTTAVQENLTAAPEESSGPAATLTTPAAEATATVSKTSAPVKKTTYAPLPAWMAIAGLCVAALLAGGIRR